jgi:cation:H+ antiporter
MMLIDLLLVAAGVAILAVAGDRLVDFAAAIAEKARLTPAVVGLTVVAAGTSAPELFVSVTAALGGAPGISVGNVVGSNIANVALVLGAGALIYPIPLARAILRFEYPFMVLASFALPLVCLNGELGRAAGSVFVIAIVGFVAWSIRLARGDVAELAASAQLVPELVEKLVGRSILVLLLGIGLMIACLALGAHILVLGASSVALTFGVSERVIGLTIVAVGTSLPEFVATLAAALKRHHEMAVANIVGSNLFNILLILGVTGLIHPIPVAPEILRVDIPVMIVTALILAPVAARGRELTRVHGCVLLVAYATYIVTLF